MSDDCDDCGSGEQYDLSRPIFKGATCKGCYALGTACGSCERCTWERAQTFAQSQARCGQKFTCAATPWQIYTCALERGHEGECDDHPNRGLDIRP